MNKYTARFTGRLSGAIGRFHSCTVDIEAENEEAARLKLYDTHDHIQGLKLEEQKEKTGKLERSHEGKQTFTSKHGYELAPPITVFFKCVDCGTVYPEIEGKIRCNGRAIWECPWCGRSGIGK